MKKNYLLQILKLLIAVFSLNNVNAQCDYIPATSTKVDTLSYVFSGGSFQSYGCTPIDPTYWISGNGKSITVNFVSPQTNPSFRVWGMNTDDSAIVTVNSVSYPLTATSASYDVKILCGTSPGPDGILFSNGKLVGANTPMQGNFSYQNVKLKTTNISSFKVTSISGAGWGFAGVSVNCQDVTAIDQLYNISHATIFPNPANTSATVQFDFQVTNAVLTIYDLYGQNIKTINNISGSQIKIDRDNLQDGIYFIRLVQNDKIIFTDKLIFTNR